MSTTSSTQNDSTTRGLTDEIARRVVAHHCQALLNMGARTWSVLFIFRVCLLPYVAGYQLTSNDTLALIVNGHATIPSNVTSIGNGAFRNMALTSVSIPDGVTDLATNYTSIPHHNLTRFSLGRSLTEWWRINPHHSFISRNISCILLLVIDYRARTRSEARRLQRWLSPIQSYGSGIAAFRTARLSLTW